MTINAAYMANIIDKVVTDIRAKEIDFGMNGVKVQIALGWEEANVLLNALEAYKEGVN